MALIFSQTDGTKPHVYRSKIVRNALEKIEEITVRITETEKLIIDNKATYDARQLIADEEGATQEQIADAEFVASDLEANKRQLANLKIDLAAQEAIIG